MDLILFLLYCVLMPLISVWSLLICKAISPGSTHSKYMWCFDQIIFSWGRNSFVNCWEIIAIIPPSPSNCPPGQRVKLLFDLKRSLSQEENKLNVVWVEMFIMWPWLLWQKSQLRFWFNAIIWCLATVTFFDFDFFLSFVIWWHVIWSKW